MYLSATKTATLSHLFGLLSEDATEHEVRGLTGQALLRLFDADYFASFIWDRATQSFGHGVTINMDPANLATYDRYYQFHDPITHLLRERRAATLVTQVMPQRELVKTEFFNDFLARDGLYHGVNLHACEGDLHLGDVRIWRHRRGQSFDQDTLDLLRLVQPALTASLRRRRRPSAEAPLLRRTGFSGQAALLLSEREKEVAERVCRGYSDKEIAAEFHIGFSTVRTHVDRIYAKLGVRTRTQLTSRWNR